MALVERRHHVAHRHHPYRRGLGHLISSVVGDYRANPDRYHRAANSIKNMFKKYGSRAGSGKRSAVAKQSVVAGTGPYVPNNNDAAFVTRYPKKGRRFTLMRHLHDSVLAPIHVMSSSGNYWQGALGERTNKSIVMGSVPMIKKMFDAYGPIEPNMVIKAQGAAGVADTVKYAGVSARRLRILRGCYSITYENNSNIEVSFKVYECVPRIDVLVGNFPLADTGAEAFIGTGLSADDADAGLLADGSAAVESLPTGISNSYALPQWTPYQSNRFCQNFKIIRVHTVTLGPKAKARRDFYLENQIVDEKIVDELSAGNYGLSHRFSRMLLHSWVGQMVNIQTVGTGDETYGNGTIYTLKHLDFKGKFLPRDRPNRFQFPVAFNGTDIDGQTSVLSLTGTASTGTYKAPIDLVVETTATGGATLTEV